jgi:hypothetical protein
VKRALLVIATAVLFLNTFAASTTTWIDGGAGGTSCGSSICKP